AENVHRGRPGHHAACPVRLRPGVAVQPGQGLPDPAPVRRGPWSPPRSAPRHGKRSGDLLVTSRTNPAYWDLARKDLLAVCGEVCEASAEAGVEASAEASGEAASEAVSGAAVVALPGSVQEAAAVMRVAASRDLAVVVRGGGSRLSWGTPASRCDLAVDVSR